MTKAYYYHVTSHDGFGDQEEIVLHPRTPRSVAMDENNKPLEPLVRRICVAPTVAQCLVAVDPYTDNDLSVFRTARQIKGHYARSVPDVSVTGERWVLGRCRFVKVAEIPGKLTRDMPMSCRGDKNRLVVQRKDLSDIEKILKKRKKEIRIFQKDVKLF